ncbi:hypothetical protein VQ02_14900 [Methylobacterium variabile]|uniref:Large polyvalent protein associated domain-containing protein n=2 Tax=Methylobacterium variabile TaxID=298794 RepID=A0A0J6VC88_9HYPH|nr:hypothetical protein VQ02_14900 [Methylobacterium variabile]
MAEPEAPKAQPQATPTAAPAPRDDIDAFLDSLPPVQGSTAAQAKPEALAARPTGVTLEEFDALMAPPAPQAQPPATPASTGRLIERLSPAGQVGGAIVTGAAKSIYETKDFIFGKTAEEDKSGMRRDLEQLDEDLGNASIGNSFVSGLSQFATGMLGAGKLVGIAKAVPAAGAAIGGLEASRKGAAVLSSAKAAAVGAVAFDPSGPRLSDLVQQFPALQNPVSEFLASKPGDSAALGRAKNALESIGVDAALAGVFAASVAGFKALRSGEQAVTAAALKDLSAAVAHKDAKLAASKGDLETVEAIRQEHPEEVAQAEAALPPPPAPAPVADALASDAMSARSPRRSLAEREAAGETVDYGPEAAPAGSAMPAQGPRNATVSALPEEVPPGVRTEEGGLPGTLPAQAETTAPRLLDITDDQVQRLIAHSRADTEQLLQPGGWEGAIDRGYRFGDGGRIPWQKFALEPGTAPGTSSLDQVIRRVADEFAGEIAAAKGGDGPTGVRSDAMQDRLIQQRVAIYGDDPEMLMGALQLAGRNADRLVADVAAADLITLRAAQDAQNLADRIKLGMLEEFGGDLSEAMKALRGHYQVAATARAESAAMVANAARTLRRQRAEFGYTPEDVAAMAKLSDAQMLNLIESAGRDPRVADRLLRQGFWSKVVDDASYLYVNNLLWGLRTHFVNLSTNSYMLFGRPLERMLGGAVQGDMARVAENARQYAYMAGSLHEAWRDAVRTWQIGDSILAPHSAELSASSAGRSVNWVAEGFKQWDSIPNILSNAYTGFMKAAGLPTRALGSVDELVKQVVYRSKVMAAAHGQGIEAGLEGPALTEHVRQTLNAAFDDAGRAVDLKALEEAQIATFQQDLLPNTLGKWVQSGTSSVPALRFIVPFVRTPTNVLRTGWKMTPILNYAQKEFQQMIRGEMGAEKQAQAIGQAAMGSLFMGTAAMLTHAGYVTGGGPSDPELKKTLMAAGWQPYSFVIPGEDGKPTYVNFGRYDPIAMPFGIMADVVDIWERDHDGDGPGEQAVAALGGVFLSLVKQLGQKTYLTSLNDALDVLRTPDRSLGKVAGGMAANFVPFASGLRFINPDPLMRETRSVVDKIKATVPGLSDRLPPQRDIFGDPLTVHKGLWVHGAGGLVDAEVRRMVDEAGVLPFGPPDSAFRGVDLRDVRTADGRNAYDRYQELAGHLPRGPSMKATVERIMRTAAYQKAPDGKAETKGTKQAMFTGTVAKYREAAGKLLMADPNVRQAVYQQNLKARAEVAARDGAKSDRATGAEALEKLGRATGVDLSGVIPTQQ